MSIKGSRTAATKNLDTLIECAENGDDSSSLMLADDATTAVAADRLHAPSNDGPSIYESASSNFSAEDAPPLGGAAVGECSTPPTSELSPTTDLAKSSKHSDPSSKSRSNLSPKESKRKRLSAHSIESYDDTSLNRDDYQPTASSSTSTSTDAKSANNPNSKAQKSFSLRILLNNITAPMRRGKSEKSGATDIPQPQQPKPKESTTTAPPPSNNNFRSSMKRDSQEAKPANNAVVLKRIEFFDAKERQNSLSMNEPDNNHRQLISDFGPIPSNINHFRRRYMVSVMETETPDHDCDRVEMIECQVCFCYRMPQQFPTLTNCSHRPCRACLELYLKIEIMESRVMINCPECTEALHPNDIYEVLCMHYQLLLSYERFMVRRVMMTDPDVRWCPAPDCDYAVIANSCAACPKLECERPGCGTLFCYHCKGEWHANQTCDEARGKSIERMFASAASALSSNRSGSLTEIVGASSSSNDQFKPGDLKACPRCRTLIIKMNDGSCNHLVCPMCQADFCWLCLKEISDLHYLSPTGCTFWGKKPWTRKKKLLWQVGTLIGAPVGIALIAGLAVPGIICGVPVFVGRKVYQRFSASSKARRRLLTAAGVSGALVVSPVLAVLAVGVGVPIMLAYVYGVVPLSLCRNGGCGGGSNEATNLENLVEDEEEFGNIASSLRQGVVAYSDEEHSRLLLRKQFSDIEKMERSSMATRISTNSGFSLNAASTSATGRAANGHPAQPDVLCASSAKINLMVEQRKRKMSVESYATSLGEKVNYESASTKAHAGSHYHFDNKSVHTVETQSDIQNEENSSIKAMSGSIDGKSLGDSASIRFAKCRANSRPERDLSPSSIYSLNDPLSTRQQQQSRFNGQALAQLANTIVSDGVELSADNIANTDNRDPFRVRTLLDNLRQILNDDAADDELPVSKSQKKKPPHPTTKHHGSSTSISSGNRVAAKIRYDNHQRALSVQIPAASATIRRSMPSLASSKETVETAVTTSGTVVAPPSPPQNLDNITPAPADDKKSRRRRFVNFFRSTRAGDRSNDSAA